MLSEVSMFPALLVAPEPGLLWEELLWEWGSPFWPCPGLLNSSFTPGFASSLSCKFGKALCAVSRVTAAEMGSQIVWVSPAKTPMGLEIWDFCGGTGSCQMDASHSLWPAGSPSSPGQPKGHSSCSWPAGIAHRQPFCPPCPVSKQSCCGAGCAVFYDRSDLRCWCLDSYPCPFKKKVVILIIFEYLIPLNWLRALHDHQWHLQKCFLRASSLTRLWFCRGLLCLVSVSTAWLLKKK